MSKRKFTWDSWDYDGDGDAYIVAKDECPEIEFVPEFICKHNDLHSDCMDGIRKDIKEGWCKFQCRSDWVNCDGPHGFYVVTEWAGDTKNLYGKRNPGWFPVWIVKKGDWY